MTNYSLQNFHVMIQRDRLQMSGKPSFNLRLYQSVMISFLTWEVIHFLQPGWYQSCEKMPGLHMSLLAMSTNILQSSNLRQSLYCHHTPTGSIRSDQKQLNTKR